MGASIKCAYLGVSQDESTNFILSADLPSTYLFGIGECMIAVLSPTL
jgi:hypothetical protein